MRRLPQVGLVAASVLVDSLFNIIYVAFFLNDRIGVWRGVAGIIIVSGGMILLHSKEAGGAYCTSERKSASELLWVLHPNLRARRGAQQPTPPFFLFIYISILTVLATGGTQEREGLQRRH